MPQYDTGKSFKWVDNNKMSTEKQIVILSAAKRLLSISIENLQEISVPGNEFTNVLISVLKDMRGDNHKFGFEVCLSNWQAALEGKRDNESEFHAEFSEWVEVSVVDRSTGDDALVDIRWIPGVKKINQALVTTHRLEVPSRISTQYNISDEDWFVHFEAWFTAHFPGGVHRDLVKVVQV